MKKLLLLTIFLSLTLSVGNAQDYTMTDGLISVCSGTFSDSGGSTADYSNDEDYTYTICSPFMTDAMELNFSSWNMGIGDILLVYDGDTATGSPLGVYNSAITPTMVTSVSTNCLTLRFISNSSDLSAGWQASISCIDNCQTIDNTITTSRPLSADGILRICPNEIIDFSGTTTFSVDGTGAVYEWFFSDDLTMPMTGATVSKSFSSPGIYTVDYVTTDAMGCRDRILEEFEIHVSTIPDFTGTVAADTSICLGESTTIIGVVDTVEFFGEVAPPISDIDVQLGDGNQLSVPFESCITVSGFPNGATIQNASDLVSFFAEMEHSYLGDLTIELTSPNGTVISIIQYPNSAGGTFLGVPVDNETTPLIPGTGFVYNFTEVASATQTFDQASASFATLPAGDYLPENPFSDLIGSPLNGDWCISFIDDLLLDNGFLFAWGINFNPAIVPTALRFEPTIVSSDWQSNPDITAVNGTEITVTPSVSGQNSYEFVVVDDFGCTYTETVIIDVAPEITSVQPNDLVVCQGSGNVTVDLTSKDDEIRNGLDPTAYDVTYFNNQTDADSDMNSIMTPDTFTVTADTTVWARIFDNVNGCYKVEQVNIVFESVDYNAVADLELCDDPSGDEVEVFDLSSQDAAILGSQSATDFNVTYHTNQTDADMNMAAIINPDSYANTMNPQVIYVRVSNAQDQDCYTTGQFNLVVLEEPQISAIIDVSDCATDPVSNTLDLTLSDYDTQVLNGLNAADYSVTYHNDETDADNGTSSLGTTYASSDQEIIYARVTHNNTGCYNYTSFMVTVEVCDIFIPEGFSPNGDGINDTFKMTNIEQFTGFEFKVFNRNGISVYETKASNYEEFAGIPNKGILSGDGMLPVGTYFYVIKFNDSSKEDVSSWLYINY